MPAKDDDESEVLAAFEKGELKSVGSQAEMARIKAAARATALTEGKSPNRRTLDAVVAARAGKATKVSIDKL
jgi:hypothetical protein